MRTGKQLSRCWGGGCGAVEGEGPAAPATAAARERWCWITSSSSSASSFSSLLLLLLLLFVFSCFFSSTYLFFLRFVLVPVCLLIPFFLACLLRQLHVLLLSCFFFLVVVVVLWVQSRTVMRQRKLVKIRFKQNHTTSIRMLERRNRYEAKRYRCW